MKFWLVRVASVFLVLALCYGIQAFALGQTVVAPRLFALTGLYVTLAVSLNLINGITGQFSIGHAAFYQIGAVVAGFMSVKFFDSQPLAGPGWLIAMGLVGGVAASLAGLAVGLPSLRLRGDYLAIVTLGFGEIIRIVVLNTEAVGGSYGLNVKPKLQYIWLIWLLAAVTIAVSRNLLKTAWGLAFLAVREDEIASNAMGVNVTKIKVLAFVLGSAFAGAAGALLAHYEGFINPTMFSMDLSFIVLTMVVLGGSGSITGSVLAAIALFLLPEFLRSAPPVTGAALAGAAIATAVTVAAMRWVTRNVHGETHRKVLAYLAGLAGGFFLFLLLWTLFNLSPGMAGTTFEASKLRMVIFAATLIILMMLRPQGIFAHHEFSWDWVKRVLGRGRPSGVSA